MAYGCVPMYKTNHEEKGKTSIITSIAGVLSSKAQP